MAYDGRGGVEGGQPSERIAVAFVRVLRARGMEVTTDSLLLFARALAVVGLAERDGVYWAGRSTLVRDRDDFDEYDLAFAAFWERTWGGGEPVLVSEVDRNQEGAGEERISGAADEDAETRTVPPQEARWSPIEVLRERDFAAYSEAEFEEARRLMADIRFAGARRRSRRLQPSRRVTARPDVRRTVRAALRTVGEPMQRPSLEPGDRRRRLVLLLDVSGSMEPYARAFVRLLHAAVSGRGRVDAFALGTRLTRITRELRSRDPDAAVRAAARRVVDWSGGTRLGACLQEFNDAWGIPGMARGAVVVVLSDGWDRGDPVVLAEQMERLGRVAHRIVWVNPLKASEDYAPIARGMAAALPFVDDFVEGHSLEAFERLGEVVSR